MAPTSTAAAWGRLYPRYASVRGDEDVECLKLPLIGGDESSSDEAADDDDVAEDEAAGLLLKIPRHSRRDDRGFLARVEPKLLRSLHALRALVALAAAAFVAPFTPSTPSATTKERRGMTIRARRKTESVEDMTERALGWLALLTVAAMLLLVLGVAAHAA